MELEARGDDDFGDRLAECYEKQRNQTEPRSASRFPEDDTVDEDLQSCLACLTLIDRVRRRHQIQDSLRARRENPTTSVATLPLKLAHFKIEKELGRGGAGIVALATDTKLGRKVALKVPHPQFLISDDLRQRFAREAEATARLDHPHIVRVYEVGEDGPISFIASEYCDGKTLARWKAAQEAPIPPRVAASIVRDLAEAVQHAHTNGVLHRDIKPSNVLITGTTKESGKSIPFVKLCDLGLAKVLDDDAQDTRTGDFLGTPAYMAPEQAEGKVREIDTRTDVYALGVLLFELLCGKPPFEGETRSAILYKVINEEVPRVRSIRKDAPFDLAVIVARCLSRSKKDRYPSAMELAEDLDRYLAGEPIHARPILWWERLLKWAQRRPLVAACILVAAISVAALMSTLAISSARIQLSLERLQKAEHQARDEAYRAKIHLYKADIQAANEAIAQSNRAAARESLDRQIPHMGESDLRTWPWYYLSSKFDNPAHAIKGNTVPIIDLALSEDGAILAGGLKKGQVVTWDFPSGKERHRASVHLGDTTCVRFSPLTGKLWSTGDDGSVREWDGESSRLVTRLTPGVKEMSFSPDGKSLATGNQWGQVSILDAQTGKLIKLIRAHTEVIGVVEYSPNGRWLMTASEDSIVRLWSTVDYQKVAELPCESKIVSGSFSPDSKRLALALRKSSEVAVLSIEENERHAPAESKAMLIEELLPTESNAVMTVAGISADGSTVIGNMASNGQSRAWRWTKSVGLQFLGSLSDASARSEAKAVSANGLVVVGQSDSKEGPQAFRWTQETGMQGLGDLAGGSFQSEADAVSADGQTVFGQSSTSCGGDIFTWTSEKGMSAQRNLYSKDSKKHLRVISPQGSLMVCHLGIDDASKTVMFKQWSLVEPFTIPADWTNVRLTTATDARPTLSGTCTIKDVPQSFQWRTEGFHLIPTSHSGFSMFEPVTSSFDGAVLGGRALKDSSWTAALWGNPRQRTSSFARQGIISISQWASDLGLSHSLDGWNIECVNAISQDLHVMAGVGVAPSGKPAAWILRWPTKSQLGPVIDRSIALQRIRKIPFTDTILSVRWLDDNRLACGDIEGQVALFDGASGVTLGRFLSHDDRVNAIAVDRKRQSFVTGSRDGLVLSWPDAGSIAKILPMPGEVQVNRLQPTGSSGFYISGYFGSQGHIFEVRDKQFVSHRLFELDGKARPELGVLSPDQRWVAWADGQGSAQIFDVTTRKRVATVQSRTAFPSLDWMAESQLITLTSVINVWDPANGRKKATLGTGDKRLRQCMSLLPDGKRLACSNDSVIELWNLPEKKLLTTLTGHHRTINAMSISRDGKTLASGSSDQSIRLWDLESYACEGTLLGQDNEIESIAWLSDNQTLVTSGNRLLTFWDRRTRSPLFQESVPTNMRFAVSRDGRTLAGIASTQSNLEFREVSRSTDGH
ncbi:protein kinase [bacterium]|nr:protein kinase [bacterium]